MITFTIKTGYYVTAIGFKPTTTKANTQPFSQTGQMIELCCEYLSVCCIWLYHIIISHTRFRVNLHYKVAWNSKNSLFEADAVSEI